MKNVKKKATNEQKFLTIIKNDCKQWTKNLIHYYKIPDTAGGARFLISKPFDCYLGVDGRLGAMEAKYGDIQDKKSLSLKDLRPNQHEGLEKIIRDGGLGYVFYQFKFAKEKRFYFWEYRDFLYMFEKHGKSALNIVPIDVIDKMPYVLPHRNEFGDLTYDLQPFIDDWKQCEEMYG